MTRRYKGPNPTILNCNFGLESGEVQDWIARAELQNSCPS